MQHLAQMMGRGPYGPGMGWHAGSGWWWLGNLLPLLVLAGLVALGIVLVLRLVGRSTPGNVEPSGTAPDTAITELRMRYARGEIARDDYLRTAADLGAPTPPSG